MRSKEFVAALGDLGLSKTACSRFLGVTLRTVSYWADGDRKVPEPVSRLILYMLAKGITPSEVMEAIGLEGPHRPPKAK